MNFSNPSPPLSPIKIIVPKNNVEYYMYILEFKHKSMNGMTKLTPDEYF